MKIYSTETFIDLMNVMERTPHVCLGNLEGSKSFICIVAYLNALEYSKYYDEDGHSYRKFKDWLCADEESCLPAECPLEHIYRTYGDRSYDVFFEKLRKYKVECGLPLTINVQDVALIGDDWRDAD